MILKYILLFLTILASSNLFGSSPMSTWEDFTSEEGNQIVIRGFLYPRDNKDWVLAKEPNLKSCCVGSPNKAKSQIVLMGDFPDQASLKTVIVSGILHKREVEGKEIYTLSEPQIIKHSSNYTAFYGLLVAGILLFSFFRLNKRK